MPLTPTFGAGIRLDQPDKEFTEGSEVQLQPDDPHSSIDAATGAKITVESDGSVTIDTKPVADALPKSSKFSDNLALYLDDGVLGILSEDLMAGVDSDLRSRQVWEQTYNKGIDLLGLKLEEASAEVGVTGNISKVTNPLLLEATVRHQANASAEMLPASGPVKVRDDDPNATTDRLDLADAFEKDFNHYLTVVAKEYYPDTQQLLFNQGWCGMAYKKIYMCPIRKRPCSDYVAAPDLILSSDIVDLENCARTTHRTFVSNGTLRRLIKAKVYRKVDLSMPVETPSQVDEKISEVMGIDTRTKLPADHRHELYEIYAELDIPGYEKDIPLPYKVTIDRDSRQILDIRRNWKEGDEDYCADVPFVKFGMIPGLDYYDLGFVHLLGNTTRALTAIDRMQLDSGQFSIFPGFLFSKQAGKQTSNVIRINPGQGMEIDTGGMPINQVAMALPYPGPSQVLAAISEKKAEDGMRLGMANEVTVGEGRADVPVGTTMALIEQATKVMAAVHKRNHVSQQREFEKLRDLFKKDPTCLWKFAKNPARKWEMASEFADLELVPASDPNVPSHTHRLMQANALVMLAQASPQTFNPRNVAVRALRAIGFTDVDNLLAPLPPPNAPPPPPPPEVMIKMQELQLKQQQMQLSAQEQAAHDQARLQETQTDNQQRIADRESRERIEMLKLKGEQVRHSTALQSENQQHIHNMISDHVQHQNEMQLEQVKHQSELQMEHQKTAMTLASQERQSEAANAAKAAKEAAKPAPKDKS